ncbi:MAG TPA: glycosyltransferase, partial [Pirellulales bacterium]|nr:glycosyltransferase [Pirellulales bacterium]
ALQFGFLTWGLWENFRFGRARLRKTWPREHEPRVALFAPCKGFDVGLEDNLRPLLEQEYANYTLTFIVESADDPVCGCLRRLMAKHPTVDARLLVAGIATDCGQKVHNLRAATAKLPGDVEVLAFVDSDARPRPDWLRRLIARLPEARIGAVTGYRWFVPSAASAAQCLLYSINTTVASGFGPGGHHVIWGGSWAIRRDVFDRLRLRDAWRGTLSDDLVATRVIRRAGLRVEFEPVSMVTSPVAVGWRQALEFIRRQYVIARSYAFAWWLLALAGSTVPMVTFWGGLVLLAVGLWQGAAWTWIPAAVCPAYYAGTLLRGYQRWVLGRLYVRESSPLMQRVAWLDIWAGPLVTLANWLAILASVVGSRLEWRGIRYRLGRGGRVLSVERRAAEVRQAGNHPQSVPTLVGAHACEKELSARQAVPHGRTPAPVAVPMSPT